MSENLVPKENIKAYSFIYCIENLLRELIIDELEKFGGSKWYKTYLPADVLEKYRNGIYLEKNIKWVQLVPCHPIYYIDFPDLKKIILRRDCWKNVFKNIFNREDIVKGIFAEIDNIRNRIAHNRKVANEDVVITKKSYEEIKNCIGGFRFQELIAKCTCESSILEKLTKLEDKSNKLYQICKTFKPLEDFNYWEEISNRWWFDEVYLGCEIKDIIKFFKTLEEYKKLPRLRGKGHKIESWVSNRDIDFKYNKARKEFSALLRSMGVNTVGIR